MDVDAIRPGADFVSEIERVIASSDVVLALIGPFWAVSRDGRRRLDEPKDLVRQEVAAALAAWREKRTHLIPVLAPSAPVPSEGELPKELRGLERINAVKLSDDYWDASIEALLRSVEGSIAPPATSPPEEIRVPRLPASPAVARPLMHPPPTGPPAAHFAAVAKAISAGAVSFFLGPGVNLSDRHDDEWKLGVTHFPPSLPELAAHLAHELQLADLLDMGESVYDLDTVADYAETMLGQAPLYDAMRGVFAADYTPTRVHRALARLPRLVRDYGESGLLFVTTNYDDVLERALDGEGEAYDVVSYVAAGEHRGKFLHYPAGSGPVLVERPNEYAELRVEERPVVLKLFGGIDRDDPERDSYVVSEADQMDYVSGGYFSEMIPVMVRAKLAKSGLLFFGTSARARRFRIVLEMLFGRRRLPAKSWAVQRESDLLSRGEWNRRGVEILDHDVGEYVERLTEALALAAASGR